MPRNDGNKAQKEDLQKRELTLKNIRKNEKFIAENAGELTPHQLKDVKEHLASKIKSLEETEGTIKY
ncbi:hypothetical protein ACHOLT_11495 [Desulfitobacterium sp. Sab5]|uniref:hypothetical protein n=1 Tax=Desulfitobacterium nosdiversum TaxID=3375356 RepID=UPI003CEAE721